VVLVHENTAVGPPLRLPLLPDVATVPVASHRPVLRGLMELRHAADYEEEEEEPLLVVAVAGQGASVHNNPYYEPVDVVLGTADVEAARLDWMVAQLQSLTRRDTGLVDLGHLALERPARSHTRGPNAADRRIGI
jgi:hypothetical protein